MRTDDEILAKAAAAIDGDIFGFVAGDYVSALSYPAALGFLKEGVTLEQWGEDFLLRRDPARVRQQILDYLPFAWQKANDQRGLSAIRSIDHFVAWTWLMGDDEAHNGLVRLKAKEYRHYGKPILARLCERYGVDWKALDDGVWVDPQESADSAMEFYPPLVEAAG